jgi:hypothetical protein
MDLRPRLSTIIIVCSVFLTPKDRIVDGFLFQDLALRIILSKYRFPAHDEEKHDDDNKQF